MPVQGNPAVHDLLQRGAEPADCNAASPAGAIKPALDDSFPVKDDQYVPGPDDQVERLQPANDIFDGEA